MPRTEPKVNLVGSMNRAVSRIEEQHPDSPSQPANMWVTIVTGVLIRRYTSEEPVCQLWSGSTG